MTRHSHFGGLLGGAFGGVALVAALMAPLPALAQTTPGAPGSDQVIPEKDRSTAPRPGAGAEGQTLTDKLNKTDGVIAPPGNVDPEMRQIPPPGAGQNMPIIPPSAVDPTTPPNAPKAEPR
ncbi:MAG: hypothetical protein K2X62_16430 [Beijerinckiaceae bacterium]|jgi:hypothetical protein|nr:hypothetical protein [Beijerinckiaceae bacterium]MDO9439586.1 hypothetical protein [Beijerinckiaceae bacterium]